MSAILSSFGQINKPACVRNLLLAAMVFTGVANAADTTEQFTIQRHSIPVARASGRGASVAAEEALFKLDTSGGSVWRLGTNDFVHVAVNSLYSQELRAHEARAAANMRRLKGIVIPSVDFKQASFSNVLAFLQHELKTRDPMAAVQTNDFLRLECPRDTHLIFPLTFSARQVSFYETIQIIADISGLRLRLGEEHILMLPDYGDGETVTRRYEVSPSLRTGHGDTAFTNLLCQLGVKLYDGTWVKYFPELDIIMAYTTHQEQQQLERALELAGLVRQWPGRYRFVSEIVEGRPLLLLLDGKTGTTWIYRATIENDGSRKEAFEPLSTDPPTDF
jgi:hypothetical protein